MGFRKTATPVFVDPHIPVHVKEEASIDLILSPSFYWVKRVSIPVKRSRDVKRFLPSLFEDTIPDGNYSYYAYEDGGVYLVFAYDDKMILDTLLSMGIDSEQINRVYFAQSEFQEIQEAVAIGDECVLDVENRVVVKLPKNFVHNLEPLNLETHRFSEHDISLSRYGNIATNKSLIQFSLFVGMLIFVFALDWIVSEAKINEFDEAPEALYKEYNLPMTRVQNEVMLSTLQDKYKKQIRLREITHILLNLKLNKGEHITLYDLQEKKLKVEFVLASEKRSLLLAKSLKKQGFSYKQRYKDGLLKLEFVL